MVNVLNAKQIFELLRKQVTDSEIGYIKFEYLGISVDINDKSPVGYVLQTWLQKWFDKNNISYSTNPNSQEPPDFFIGANKSHLELKTFDYDASANFDIANFEAYCAMVEQQPDVLDADYLIMAYTLEDCKLKIKNIWLKKIWEISCASAKYPLKTQNKRDMIYNIRPACWESKNTKYPTFNNKKDFVMALHNTLQAYTKTKDTSKKWLDNVKNSYRKTTNQKLF